MTTGIAAAISTTPTEAKSLSSRSLGYLCVEAAVQGVLFAPKMLANYGYVLSMKRAPKIMDMRIWNQIRERKSLAPALIGTVTAAVTMGLPFGILLANIPNTRELPSLVPTSATLGKLEHKNGVSYYRATTDKGQPVVVISEKMAANFNLIPAAEAAPELK